MSSRQFVKLRNGALLDLDTVVQIVRKDLNEYGVVTSPAGVVVRADSDDVAFIESQLNILVVPANKAAEEKVVVAS